MEGQRLILKNGTVIEDGRAGFFDGSLWLWMPGLTMAEAAAIAFDSSATSRIIFQYGDMEDVHSGYTVCTILMQDGNEIAVCLVKG